MTEVGSRLYPSHLRVWSTYNTIHNPQVHVAYKQEDTSLAAQFQTEHLTGTTYEPRHLLKSLSLYIYFFVIHEAIYMFAIVIF